MLVAYADDDERRYRLPDGFVKQRHGKVGRDPLDYAWYLVLNGWSDAMALRMVRDEFADALPDNLTKHMSQMKWLFKFDLAIDPNVYDFATAASIYAYLEDKIGMPEEAPDSEFFLDLIQNHSRKYGYRAK